MSIKSAIDALIAQLGDKINTSQADLTLHGQNETYFPNTPPDAVAYPTSTEDVCIIVKICADNSCPITPVGAASSLKGQVKTGRTHLMDAMPIDFSQELSGWSAQLKAVEKSIV